jgi:hypothetical protein
MGLELGLTPGLPCARSWVACSEAERPMDVYLLERQRRGRSSLWILLGYAVSQWRYPEVRRAIIIAPFAGERS